MGRRYRGPVAMCLALVFMAFAASTGAASTRHKTHSTKPTRRSTGLRSASLVVSRCLLARGRGLRSSQTVSRAVARRTANITASPMEEAWA
jgi:hypothetical protein